MKNNLFFIIKNHEGIVSNFIPCFGWVQIDTKRSYMHTKQHPFIPEKKYQFIPYWDQKLTLNLVVNNQKSNIIRQLMSHLPANYTLYIQWYQSSTDNQVDQVHTRRIDIEQLPRINFVNDITTLKYSLKYRQQWIPFCISKLTRIHTSLSYHKILTTEEEE